MPTPTDPDAVANAEYARQFRRTMAMAAGAIVAGAAIGAGLVAQSGGTLSAALVSAGKASAVVGSFMVVAQVLIAEFKPDLATRWGLSRAASGDERERRISRDTTVRTFAATQLAVLIYSVVTLDPVILWIMVGSTVVNAVIEQIRLHRS
jgi:hypothetical protein